MVPRRRGRTLIGVSRPIPPRTTAISSGNPRSCEPSKRACVPVTRPYADLQRRLAVCSTPTLNGLGISNSTSRWRRRGARTASKQKSTATMATETSQSGHNHSPAMVGTTAVRPAATAIANHRGLGLRVIIVARAPTPRWTRAPSRPPRPRSRRSVREPLDGGVPEGRAL